MDKSNTHSDERSARFYAERHYSKKLWALLKPYSHSSKLRCYDDLMEFARKHVLLDCEVVVVKYHGRNNLYGVDCKYLGKWHHLRGYLKSPDAWFCAKRLVELRCGKK